MSGLAALLALSYLLGSIPFGVLVGRARGVDIRRHGSRNIGFSNALRVLGPGPAALVLGGDVLKGLAPVLAGRWAVAASSVPHPERWLLAVALAPILGHTFSVFLRFRGGRAVATTLGVLLGISWAAGLVALGAWLLALATTRTISLASITAAVSVPVYLALAGAKWEWAVFWTAISALVVARHIPNLGRVLEGSEPKIGQRVKP